MISELDLVVHYMLVVAAGYGSLGRGGAERYIRDLAELLQVTARALPPAVENRDAIAQTLEDLAERTVAEEPRLVRLSRALASGVRAGLHETFGFEAALS